MTVEVQIYNGDGTWETETYDGYDTIGENCIYLIKGDKIVIVPFSSIRKVILE